MSSIAAGSSKGSKSRTGNGRSARTAPLSLNDRDDLDPRSERRAELLTLAADMFAEGGYRSTTVRDIAERANILSGSLYHHFDSKESIVDEILRGFLDDILTTYRSVLEANDDPRQQFELLVRASFACVDRHRSAIAIFQNDGKLLAQSPSFGYLRDVSREFEEVWTGVLSRGVASGAFRDTIDQRLVYRFLRDTIWVAARWYRPGGSMTPDWISAQYLSLVLEGLAVPSKPSRRRPGA